MEKSRGSRDTRQEFVREHGNEGCSGEGETSERGLDRQEDSDHSPHQVAQGCASAKIFDASVPARTPEKLGSPTHATSPKNAVLHA